MTKAKLEELLERVDKAEGPDRVLDEELFEWAHSRKRRRSSFEQYEPSETLPEYSSSLDAAIALTEEVLPSPRLTITMQFSRERAHCEVDGRTEESLAPFRGARHKSPALALIAALLKAKIAGMK